MKTKILLKIGILLLFSLLISSTINAKDCGGNIKCECGDFVTKDYTMTEDLKCNSSGLLFTKYYDLDCNGHKIIGNGTDSGINIIGASYSNIKNCHIENFHFGIYHQIRHSHIENVYPKNNHIYNNKLVNNKIGIFSEYSSHFDSWYNNIFINNSEHGILLDSTYHDIYSNKFYKTGIKEKKTNQGNYCLNNQPNKYYDNATGPKCDCIIPQNYMYITKSVKFCPGQYYLPNGMYISNKVPSSSGLTIDCNYATIIGNNTNSAFNLQGAHGNVFKNCNIQNFTNGFALSSTYEYTNQYTNNRRYKHSVYNKVYNSSIYNVENGFILYTGSNIAKLHNNTILAKNTHIKLGNNKFLLVNLSNNWWGTNNISKIRDKIDNSIGKNYTLEPIQTINKLPDLSINKDETYIFTKDNNYFINLNIQNNGAKILDNIEIQIIDNNINNDIKITNLSYNEYFSQNSNKNFIIPYSFKSNHELHIYIDYNNTIEEENENNNKFTLKYIPSKKYFLNIDLGYSILNEEIYDFLSRSINYQHITTIKEKADIIINFKANIHSKLVNNLQLNRQKKYNHNIQINSIKNNDNQIEINILGHNTFSYLMAARNLIQNLENYINNNQNYNINKNINLKYILSYDYFNRNIFAKTQNDDKYRKTIKNILYDDLNKKTQHNITITTNNKPLNYRILNLKSNKSNTLNSYLDKDKIPILMAGGLWSDITTFKELGNELANEGYNVFLLELTGGRNTECKTCYDYTYNDLINTIYPTTVDYITTMTNADKIIYIGHSNGARTALDSITNGELNPDVIETLILVGIPGAFEDLGVFGKIINESGQLALNRLNKNNISHITISQATANMINYKQYSSKEHLKGAIATLLFIQGKYQNNDFKISSNLFKQYYNWISDNNDEQPGEGLNIENFALISGDSIFTLGKNDIIVSIADEEAIFNNINSQNKNYYEFDTLHIGMAQNEKIKNTIRQIITKEAFKNE